MTDPVEPRLLLLETSSRVAQVAVAEGSRLRGVRYLEETRRHARDLAPAVADLLAGVKWKVRDLDGVLVGRGPGSYTGLRAGIMSAKTLAYATGCTLLAIDSFAIIAAQAPDDVLGVAVIADAQQDRLYVQRFERSAPGETLTAASTLAIQTFAVWQETLVEGDWVSGPGLRGNEQRLPPGVRTVDVAHWEPQPGSLLQLGLPRLVRGERDDLWTVEPLYLRPSAAEEQWDRKK